MPAVALAIYVIFLLTAFGLRAWIQYRRTGDHGVRLFSGTGTLRVWLAKSLLLIGVVLVGAAPAAELFDIAKPAAFGDTAWLSGAGLILTLCGIVITIASQYQMGDSWRVGVDNREITPLITSGLFGVVRNPIFTGMLLAATGLLMMVPNLFSASAAPTLFLGIEMQVRWVEEPYLARVHGARYSSYARIVGRFLPRIGRLN